MIVTTSLNIDITSNNNTLPFMHFKQNDTNSHKLLINLLICGKPADLTNQAVKIYFKKPDNTKEFDNCTIENAIAGQISYIIKSNTLAAPGRVNSEITIYGNDNTIYATTTFVIIVDDLLRDDSAIESTNDFSSLSKALLDVQNISSNFNNWGNAENTRADNESTRKTNESSRVSAESIRQAAESSRITSESTRSTNEASRISAENIRVSNEKARDTTIQNINSQLAETAKQSDLNVTNTNVDTQKGRIDNLVQTSSSSFYEKCINTDTGALLVVSSGATTGQINLANVTPAAIGYTPVTNDYVRLVYGVAAGSTELKDARTGIDSITYENIGNAIRHFESPINDGIDKIGNTIPSSDIINTNYDLSMCATPMAGSIAMFSNGFVAPYKITLKNVIINSNGTTLLRVRSARWTDDTKTAFNYVNIADDLPVNNNVAILPDNFILEKGDILFVGFENGSTYYGTVNGASYLALQDYTSGTSKINANYRVAYNLNYIPHILQFYDLSKINQYHDVLLNLVKPALTNLKGLAIGDSITYGATNNNVSYVNYIANQLGIDYVNCGVSGRTLWAMQQQADSYYDAAAKFITIFGGTNDFNEGIPLGIKGSTTYDDFYGQTRHFIEYLINKYPTIPIIFITPLQRNYSGTDTTNIAGLGPNKNGNYLIDFVNIIIELCNEYGTPVIDLYRISGFNTKNIQYYTNDGLHPNDIGQKRIASIISQEILKYVSII